MLFQQEVEDAQVLPKIKIFISAIRQQAIELGTVFQLFNQLGITAFAML